VDVGRARKVGVVGTWAAGEPQPTSKVKPSRKARDTLMLMFISSISMIISLAEKKNAGIAHPGVHSP
jgi:hypothetical protein